MSEEKDVAMAARIEIGSCNCPSIHILLLDANETVLAAIALPPETARAMATDIVDLIDTVQAGMKGDVIVQCAGHA